MMQAFGCVLVYPAFQAFAAGLTLYGALILAVVIPLFVVGRRLYKRGRAQEPRNIIRTYDHREQHPPDTGPAHQGAQD